MADVISMADINATAMRFGIDFSTSDLDSITPRDEDFVLESDDEEDIFGEDDVPTLQTDFGNAIVVDNLPVVRPEKFEKLDVYVRNIYSKIGVMIKEDELWMPINPETEETLGYCFIEFHTRQEAELARELTKEYRLGRRYILSVNLLDEFDRLMNVPDDWAPPEAKPYISGENLQHWLTDERARDEFLSHAGLDVEVYWSDPISSKPDLVHPLKIEGSVKWFPFGTYLTTVHRQGVLLLGGANTFNCLVRCAHPQVKLADFSPGEKCLVTHSTHKPIRPQDKERAVWNIFNVRTGKVKISFEGTADEFTTAGNVGTSCMPYPHFRWVGGKDDKYFAWIVKNVISAYETETFSLVDKKSIKAENVVDFSCSPTSPIIATFVPELGSKNLPARVTLIQIPSKQDLRQKNLFNVSDCKMYWQSNGDYLAIKVDRYTKTKKSTYSSFEFFRIKERDIPVEVLELENKNDKIIDFAWEPKGHWFAVIHGDNMRPDMSFYSMGNASSAVAVSKLTTLTSKQANALYWSPTGRFIILAGLDGFNGQLEFYDVDELETLAVVEHYLATVIEWDPTGRYIASSVTSVHEIENGFNIWSFCGKLLFRVQKDCLSQFSWRPRPSVLTAEKEEELLNNLKKYSKKYEAEDHNASMFLSKQEHDRRRILLEVWNTWVLEWRRLNEEEKFYRQMLRDGEASDEDDKNEVKEVVIEEVLNDVTELVFN